VFAEAVERFGAGPQGGRLVAFEREAVGRYHGMETR
jgi:hypothetical protein